MNNVVDSFFRLLIKLFIFVVVLTAPPVCLANMIPLSNIVAFQTIMLEGADLSKALGEDISTLSLAAVIDDEMEPIPFQIDEYNQGGAVYFDDWSVPISGKKTIFDKADKLLFLQKDTGTKRFPHHLFDGDILAEIALTGEGGEIRYAYLIKGSRLRSDEQYVRYSSEDGLVESDFYSLTYNPENHVEWKDFSIENYEGVDNPLDTLKLRFESGILTSFNRVVLSNEQLVAKPAQTNSGPIRTTAQLDLTVWMYKLPMLKVSLQIHHYPKSIVYDVRAVMPEARRKLLVNPTISMTLDGNALFGTTVRTAMGPKQAVVVDGMISDLERETIEAGATATRNWNWASTHKNLDVLSFFDFVGDSKEPISLVYSDDETLVDNPERFVGQLPNMGYKIEQLPESGFMGFSISLYISNGFKGLPEYFSRVIRTMPEIQVNSAR